MVRNVFRLFAIFIAAVFIRRIVAAAISAFSRMAGPVKRPQQEQVAGELKQDPVCGTYVLTSSSIKRTVDGEVIHFCSTACRDKYKQVA